MLGLIDNKPLEEFAFEWIVKDWRAAKQQLDKKQDVLSPIYQSVFYQWRLKLRKDKATKKIGLFIEMLGKSTSVAGGKLAESASSTQMIKSAKSMNGLFAATFSLGFSHCYESDISSVDSTLGSSGRGAFMESAKRAVIFRPGEYQWGWARLIEPSDLETRFVQKNNVAIRAILSIL